MRLPLWTKKDMTGKRFSYKADYQVTGMQDHVPVNPYDTIAFPKKELFLFCFPASYNINTVRTTAIFLRKVVSICFYWATYFIIHT